MIGDYIVLKKEFVRSITNGTAKFAFHFEDNIVLYENISIIKQIYTPQKSNYKLFFNNSEVALDVGLFTVENQFYAPVRAIAEACKLSVTWDEDSATITFDNSKKILKMSVNNYNYTANGVEKSLETPMLLVDDRLIAPIKILSDEFGVEYQRDIVNERICLFSMDFIKSFENNNTFDDLLNSTYVNVAVTSTREENVSFIVAYYNNLEILLSTEITNSPIADGAQNISIHLPHLQNTDEVTEIKLMLWRNLNTMRPLNDAIVITNE